MKANWILMAVVLAVLSLSMAARVAAHHSTAMFDLNETVTVSGLVRQFQWTNPHGYLIVTPDEDSQDWVVELDGIQEMAMEGVRNTTFKPGDRVEVTFNPVRSGDPVGRFVSATLADGHEIMATPD